MPYFLSRGPLAITYRTDDSYESHKVTDLTWRQGDESIEDEIAGSVGNMYFI